MPDPDDDVVPSDGGFVEDDVDVERDAAGTECIWLERPDEERFWISRCWKERSNSLSLSLSRSSFSWSRFCCALRPHMSNGDGDSDDVPLKSR
jgi:hypothetical protein